jgi:hypothetical protein
VHLIWLFIAFLLIPILVHLYNFRKAKRFFFSHIRFISKISTESKAKTRLKHYLILTSRILIFLILFGTLYQFYNLSEPRSNNRYFFYLDNSISRSIESYGIFPLNENRKIIEELLLSNSESLFLTNEFSPFSNSLKKKNEVLNEMYSVDFTHFQKPFPSIYNRISESDLDNVVYFSDMQGLIKDDLNILLIDSSRNYTLVLNELNGSKNAFIDTAFIAYSHRDNSSMLLNLRIGYSKEFDEGNIVVKVVSNGKQLASIIKKVSEDPELFFDIPRSLDQQFEVHISGDEIEYDNSFFISKGIINKPKVSLISNGENTYLDKVFGNTNLFEFSRMNSSSSIDFSKLENSDLIIFNNLYRLPSGIIGQLSDPHIMIFPSDSIDQLSYQSILGFEISISNDRNLYESVFDFNSLLFSGIFDKKGERNSMPYGSSIYEFNGSFEQVIGLRNDRSFMVKSANGDLYLLSSPLKELYTDLATNALFLPVMYQLAQQSVNDGNLDIYYYPNQIVSIESDIKEIPVKILNNNFEVIPEFSHSNGMITFRIPPATPPGYYYLTQGLDTLENIAVNLSKSESIMQGLTSEELSDYFKNSSNVSIINMTDTTTSNDLVQGELSGLWKYALILILLFILVETMLHRYLK